MATIPLRFKRGTAAAMAASNPILNDGEPAFETDTGKMKVGHGSTAWNDLHYVGEMAGGDADSLNGITSGSFLRADADDTLNANLHVANGKSIIFNDASGTTGGAALKMSGENFLVYEPEDGNKTWLEVKDDDGLYIFGTRVVLTNDSRLTDARTPVSHTHAGTDITSAVPTASEAVKLATARTISITGDATGSATFDGSANASINIAVADDSHAHVIGNVDGLQTALDGKAASIHPHVITDITDLQTTLNNKSDVGHNHASLTGVTELSFNAHYNDLASISTTIDDTHTYVDFKLADDNNNDWWRWRFLPSGLDWYDAMVLKPVSTGNANLIVSGTVTADSFEGMATDSDKLDGVHLSSLIRNDTTSAQRIQGNLLVGNLSTSASITLALEDSDTGFKWISDGNVQIYANNVNIGQWSSAGMNWTKTPKVNGTTVSLSNHTHSYLPLTGGALSGDLSMSNCNITNVNKIVIKDPGYTEGILWEGGNLWQICECGDGLDAVAGDLQITQNGNRRATVRTSGEFNVPGIISTNSYINKGAFMPPNLIINSYMNRIDGSHPLGFTAIYGSDTNLTVETASPFCKAFEGRYVSTSYHDANPTLFVADPADATDSSHSYWFGNYNKGPRIQRGGLGDGWHGVTDGHILKVTGSGITASDAMVAVGMEFERNVLGTKWFFSCWVHIAKGATACFGSDAGYRRNTGDIQVTKAQADACDQGWYRVKGICSTSQITSFDGLALSFGCIPDANGDVEMYLALPYVTALTQHGTNQETWMPSINDTLYRDGVSIDTVHDRIGIFTYSPAYPLDVTGNTNIAGNLTLTGTVDGVDIASFKSSYDSHNHDAEYLGITAKASDSNLLDGYDSTAFLRADTDDTATGIITINNTDVYSLRLWNPTNGGKTGIEFSDNSSLTQKGYLDFAHSDDASPGSAYDVTFRFWSTENDAAVVLEAGDYFVGTNKVWHAGNDGSGSGLDADTLDGLHASSFNQIIGTDSDINTSGSTIVDNIYVTDGVITSMGTRVLTLADLGYTGETNATADQSASEILTLLKTVDGSGSGLDADTVDGINGSNIFAFRGTIPSGADLNTYTSKGYWHQTSNSNAGAGTNYPESLAGMLEVQNDGSMVYQRYTVYNNTHNIWVRTYYNGTWYSWYKIWHSGNDGSGSGLNADMVDSLHIHTDRNNEANKIVRTNSSGYIDCGWINTTSGTATGTPTRIYCSQDNYLRYYSPASLAPYILNQGSTKNSHTHDDRYYTETEADGRYAYKAGSLGQNFSVNTLTADSGINMTGGDLTVGASGGTSWLTMPGADDSAERTGISIGESGKMGSAALHIYYTGDGYGHIGMGSMTASTDAAYEAIKLQYQSRDVTFLGGINLASTLDMNNHDITDVNEIRFNGGDDYIMTMDADSDTGIYWDDDQHEWEYRYNGSTYAYLQFDTGNFWTTGTVDCDGLTVGGNATVSGTISEGGTLLSAKYLTQADADNPNRTIWLSGAGGIIPETNPSDGFIQYENTTSKRNYKGVLFEASSTIKSHQWTFLVPDNFWDTDVMFRFYFTSGDTSPSGDVAWTVTVEYNRQEVLGSGSVVNTMDAHAGMTLSSTPYDIEHNNWTGWTKSPSVANSGNALVNVTVSRDGTSAYDTSSNDVILLGVAISYNTEIYSDW